LASGVSLISGTLSYWPVANPSDVHVLNTNATSGTLGTFDATLLANGQYTVRLDAVASDCTGQRNEIVLTVMGENKPGRLITTTTDLKIPLAGMPLTISRVYDSLDRGRVEDFGNGWKLSTNVGLEVDRLKNVTLTVDGQRKTFFFAPTASGSVLFSWLLLPGFQPQAGLHGTLTSDGCSALVQVVGDVICAFGGDFVPNTYTYTDPAGRAFRISSNGQLQSIKDLNGVTLTFAANGITSSAGGVVVPFVRDGQGRITQITDPAGNHYNYSYDTSGNLTSISLPATANPATNTYTTDHLLLSQTDPRGNSVSQTFDSSGRLQTSTNADGTTQYSYNISTNTTTTTFPDGGVRVETDASFGKPLSITDPMNRNTSYTYDSNQNMLTKSVPFRTWTYTYDANGFQTSVKDPLNHIRSTVYNQFGEPTSITDGVGNVTTVTYDSLFNPIHANDSLGQIMASTFDAAGNPVTQTDANGRTTTFAYDSRGNLIQKTDPLNRITSYAYDSMDRVISETDPRQHTTTYAYDGLGRLLSKTDALNHTTIYTYDNNGNKLTEKDALNHQTSYQYDALNRLTQITYPDNTAKQYTYNFRGDKLTETDQSGRVTQYQYNLAGQITQVTYAFGTPEAGTVQYTYDSLGRRRTVVDERGLPSVTYNYDDAFRVTSTVDAVNRTTSYGYDAADRRTSITDSANHTTQFAYDARNRQTTVTYPDTTTTAYTYDGVGHRLTMTDQGGKVTTYAYDNAGELTSVTDALNHATQYGYDPSGNLTSITDANNHTTSFQYDSLNRRILRSLPLGQSETKSYDAVGNVSAQTDFNGKTTTFTYDTLNRLLSKIPDASLGQPTISFTYTPAGKRSTMVDATGTNTYTYDNRDRLLTKATPQGTLTYTYDLHGNLLTLKSSNANGASAIYTYNNVNQLTNAGDDRLFSHGGFSSGFIGYGYNTAGLVSNYQYPNGVATNFTYNTLNRLTQVTTSKGSTTLSNFTYTLGAAGNRNNVLELNSRNVAYGYDDTYRLTSETITADPASNNGVVNYTYDNIGNRTAMTSTLGAVPGGTFSYDNNDRLSIDSYDANGNTISSAGISYVYDFENRLLMRGAITMVYDGDGNRVSQTVGGTTTKYLVDDLNPTGYNQVIDELVGGVVNRTYMYGYNRIDQERLVGSTWTPSFYGYDGHGNVRFLTSTPGVVTDTYQFDAFGNQIASAGATPNNYLFSGEQFDNNIALYYLRARYYRMPTGRFLTMDPMLGTSCCKSRSCLFGGDSYAYASNDPVNRIDPSGRADFLEYLSNLVSKIRVRIAVLRMAQEDVCLSLYSAEVLDCSTILDPALRDACLIRAQLNLFRCQEGLPPFPDF
jgi:RHS repeat-associated protein